MPAYLILKKANLSAVHSPTGKTRHFRGKEKISAPAELQIVQYPDASGFYLLYLDALGKEQTDTYHETLEGALSQAEWEFKIKPAEWEDISPSRFSKK